MPRRHNRRSRTGPPPPRLSLPSAAPVAAPRRRTRSHRRRLHTRHRRLLRAPRRRHQVRRRHARVSQRLTTTTTLLPLRTSLRRRLRPPRWRRRRRRRQPPRPPHPPLRVRRRPRGVRLRGPVPRGGRRARPRRSSSGAAAAAPRRRRCRRRRRRRRRRQRRRSGGGGGGGGGSPCLARLLRRSERRLPVAALLEGRLRLPVQGAQKIDPILVAGQMVRRPAVPLRPRHLPHSLRRRQTQETHPERLSKPPLRLTRTVQRPRHRLCDPRTLSSACFFTPAAAAAAACVGGGGGDSSRRRIPQPPLQVAVDASAAGLLPHGLRRAASAEAALLLLRAALRRSCEEDAAQALQLRAMKTLLSVQTRAEAGCVAAVVSSARAMPGLCVCVASDQKKKEKKKSSQEEAYRRCHRHPVRVETDHLPQRAKRSLVVWVDEGAGRVVVPQHEAGPVVGDHLLVPCVLHLVRLLVQRACIDVRGGGGSHVVRRGGGGKEEQRAEERGLCADFPLPKEDTGTSALSAWMCVGGVEKSQSHTMRCCTNGMKGRRITGKAIALEQGV